MNPYKYVLEMPVDAMTDAKYALHKAIIDINEEKQIYQISVKELCNHATVARSTFYTYYNVIDDIVQEIENSLLKRLLDINKNFECEKEITEDSLEFFKKTLDFILENKKVFYLFLIKSPNHRFINKWKDAIKYHFYSRFFKYNEKESAFILELIASEAISAYMFWLQNPYEVDLSLIKKIIIKTINIYRE